MPNKVCEHCLIGMLLTSMCGRFRVYECELGIHDKDWLAGFDHKKFEEDAASGTGRFWLIRMPDKDMARFKGVMLPDYVRVLIDFGMDFAYVTVPQTQGIHSPLEVAQEVARALGAKRLLKDGVEVVM